MDDQGISPGKTQRSKGLNYDAQTSNKRYHRRCKSPIDLWNPISVRLPTSRANNALVLAHLSISLSRVC